MRVAHGHACPFLPAIESLCAENAGSSKSPRHFPRRRCSICCSADARGPQRFCRLLTPFDTPVPTRRSPRIGAVTRRRWMHHLHAQVSELRAFGELRGAQRAAIDILPFQLEPALALVRGHGSRFLLADEVGLGKTIQAGLMLSELLQRGWCDRALIVTPPGLRQQWADELLHRFSIDATVIDAASLAARACSLPCDVNPWAVEPVAIASIDFIKQPEVLRGLASQSWDALIVDEAHQATVASLRYDAVSELARRARHVVLLTATPHAGDERSYRALCAIGSLTGDDPMLRFRRTRELMGLPRSRRVHLLAVKAAPAGVEMYRLLEDYLAAALDDRAQLEQARCAAGRDGAGEARVFERAVACDVARKAHDSAHERRRWARPGRAAARIGRRSVGRTPSCRWRVPLRTRMKSAR